MPTRHEQGPRDSSPHGSPMPSGMHAPFTVHGGVNETRGHVPVSPGLLGESPAGSRPLGPRPSQRPHPSRTTILDPIPLPRAVHTPAVDAWRHRQQASSRSEQDSTLPCPALPSPFPRARQLRTALRTRPSQNRSSRPRAPSFISSGSTKHRVGAPPRAAATREKNGSFDTSPNTLVQPFFSTPFHSQVHPRATAYSHFDHPP